MKPHSTSSCLFLGLALVLGCSVKEVGPEDAPDIRSVAADLVVPPMTEGSPGPGKRVRQVAPGYEATDVHHALYLPVDWEAEGRYPLIVEFAGNGSYRNHYGDVSTGVVEGSRLGYGISAGKRFIWACMPYLNDAGTANVPLWWGDSPTYRVGPTLEYCKKAVPWICERYGGDADKVVLVGFSRGAIACNYIGLHDDEIASLRGDIQRLQRYLQEETRERRA